MTSSARLQDEADAARAGLSSALDDLRQNVTTTALTTGAMTFAKEGSTAVARAAIDKALASPFAAMLIGAGIVMLMSTDKTSPTGAVADKANATLHGAAGMLGKMGSGLAGVASSALAATKSASATVADTATGAATSVSSKASGLADKATEGYAKATDMVAQSQEQGAKTLEDAQKLIHDTKTRLETFAAEQPVLVAALGVAFGAALGASLPITEAERKFMGEASKKAGQKGSALALQVADTVTGKLGGENITAKVGEVVGAAASTVTQGLSKS
jgi:hypothetical protein